MTGERRSKAAPGILHCIYVRFLYNLNMKMLVGGDRYGKIKTIRGIRAITNLKGHKPIEILNLSVLLESEE